MRNTRIMYRNLWRTGTIVAHTEDNPQFPAENSQDDDTTLCYRSMPASPTGSAYITIDLGVATQYDYVAILNHRISSGAAIYVYGADDAAITVNVVSDALTWNSLNIRAFLAAARTKRYVAMTMTDAANPDGYAQWGTIVLGKYADLGVQVQKGYEDGYDDYTEMEYSPSRNLFVTQDAPARRRFAVEHTQLGVTAKATLLDLLQNNGKHLAFEICFDYTAPNTNTYWVTLLETSQAVNVAYNYWTWTATIEEHA